MVAAHCKKDDLLHCWTRSRIFPAIMRTFTKDTALSEQGRGAAWHGEQHGRGMLCVNRPLLFMNILMAMSCVRQSLASHSGGPGLIPGQ